MLLTPLAILFALAAFACAVAVIVLAQRPDPLPQLSPEPTPEWLHRLEALEREIGTQYVDGYATIAHDLAALTLRVAALEQPREAAERREALRGETIRQASEDDAGEDHLRDVARDGTRG